MNVVTARDARHDVQEGGTPVRRPPVGQTRHPSSGHNFPPHKTLYTAAMQYTLSASITPRTPSRGLGPVDTDLVQIEADSEEHAAQLAKELIDPFDQFDVQITFSRCP